MRIALVVVTLAVAAAGPAYAQSVNVHFAPSGATLPSTYAAAGGAGTWNTVSGLAGSTFPLVATDGSATAVTMTQSPTNTLLATTDPSVSGDDATLLNNGLVTSGAETCLFFNGVTPGHYEVLIYAWLPNQPTVKSRTRQDSAPSTIDVGGAWTGAHVEGVTYARYYVDVGSNGMLPTHSGLAPTAPSAALNGVQFRIAPSGGGADAGTSGGGADASTGGGGGGGGIGDDAGTTGTSGSHHGGCAAGHELDTGSIIFVALGFGFVFRRRRQRS